MQDFFQIKPSGLLNTELIFLLLRVQISMLKVVLIYIKFWFVIILEVHTFYFKISIASVLFLYRMWEGIIMYAVTDYSECRTLGQGVSTASWLTPQARITRTCVCFQLANPANYRPAATENTFCKQKRIRVCHCRWRLAVCVMTTSGWHG